MFIMHFIKTHKILSLFVLFLAIIGSAILFAMQLPTEEVPPQQRQQPFARRDDQIPFKDSIKVGQNSLDQIEVALGNPARTKTEGDFTVYEYGTQNQYLFNQVFVKDGDIEIIKEPIPVEERQKAGEYSRLYGDPPVRLYDRKDPNNPFNLFIYPDLGFAYEGHEDGGILRTWYFEPQNLNSILSNIATDYSLEPSELNKY